MPSAQLVADLARVLEDDPRASDVAQRSLALHREHDRDTLLWLGFSWDELRLTGVSWTTCRNLVVAGLLTISYSSRKFTLYKLVDPEATVLALGALRESVQLPDEARPADLFDIIVGLERAKQVSLLALDAERPVPVLYLGPPGSAKTEFLRELHRLPRSQMVTGGATSRVGLEDTFLDAPAGQAPRYLLYDELEKAPAADAAGLLSLAEEGVLRVTKHRRRHEWRGLVSIFATCNRLPDREELRDRFTVLTFAPYTPADFKAVCFNFLTRREGMDEEFALELAHLCSPRTRSVRRVRDVARLSGGDRRLAAELVDVLLPGGDRYA